MAELRPRPRWGSLYIASPDRLAGFKGPTSKMREEMGGNENEGKGKEEKGEGGVEGNEGEEM